MLLGVMTHAFIPRIWAAFGNQGQKNLYENEVSLIHIASLVPGWPELHEENWFQKTKKQTKIYEC